jgi:hypothetical protein
MDEKPMINYRQADGTFISFRESMAAYAPNDDEFSKLKTKIVNIIGQETTESFDDTLCFLITLLREKAFLHANAVSATAIQKELSGLTNQITKLQRCLDKDLSNAAQTQLGFETMKVMSESEIEDPFEILQNYVCVVLDICEKTKSNIKGTKPQFTPLHMRQVLAEELARELDRMGIEPKKYREGEFVEILKQVLKMISCKVNGHRISISIPADLFKVASKAIDDFPTKEPFLLLAFD